MSDRIVRMLPKLKRLKRMSKNEQKCFIETCNKDIICGLCEIGKNLLKGKVPLKVNHLKELKRRKKLIRELVLKNTAVSKKKKILQKGGFIGALLTPVLSFLGGLLAKK